MYKIINYNNGFGVDVYILHENKNVAYVYNIHADGTCIYANYNRISEVEANEYILGAEEFAKKWLEHNKEWL